MGVSEKRQNFHFGVEYPFKAFHSELFDITALNQAS